MSCSDLRPSGKRDPLAQRLRDRPLIRRGSASLTQPPSLPVSCTSSGIPSQRRAGWGLNFWSRSFLARFFWSSTIAWICSVLVAYIAYLPRDSAIDLRGFKEAIEAAMPFNPVFVTVGAAISIHIMSQWLRSNELNRFIFGGWVAVVTLATSAPAAVLLSAIRGKGELLAGLLAIYFWMFLGLLPIWSILGGIIIGPPTSRFQREGE